MTVFRPSRRLVVRARIWVIIVAKTKCHVVKKMGNPGSQLRSLFVALNPAVSSTHLLNKMTDPLKKIQILKISACPAWSTYATKKAGWSSNFFVDERVVEGGGDDAPPFESETPAS